MEIYVFGLGHVGLPLACFVAMSGLKVNGIDCSQEAVKAIEDGKINIYEYYNNVHISKLAQDFIANNMLTVSTEFKRTDNTSSILVISVGIKSSEDFVQDISPIEQIMDTILPQLVPDDLIIFRTTLIPGTIDKYVAPRLEKLNFPVHLAYCPETIAETRAFEELRSNPVVIAGINEESFNRAKNFFQSLSSNSPIYRASSIKTAELVKVVENVSRDVNIALANELSDAANSLGIDIYEVQALANTHPRVNILSPGPGVGGYCLPNALIYLKEALKDNSGSSLPLTKMARSCNLMRPDSIVKRLEQILVDNGKVLNCSTIAIIGLAMKDNCADCRYSPAVDIANKLIKKGAIVKGYDPVVGKKYDFQVDTFEQCIEKSDCMIIAAMQKAFIFPVETIVNLMNKPAIVYDTRNCFSEYIGIRLYKA